MDYTMHIWLHIKQNRSICFALFSIKNLSYNRARILKSLCNGAHNLPDNWEALEKPHYKFVLSQILCTHTEEENNLFRLFALKLSLATHIA